MLGEQSANMNWMKQKWWVDVSSCVGRAEPYEKMPFSFVLLYSLKSGIVELNRIDSPKNHCIALKKYLFRYTCGAVGSFFFLVCLFVFEESTKAPLNLSPYYVCDQSIFSSKAVIINHYLFCMLFPYRIKNNERLLLYRFWFSRSIYILRRIAAQCPYQGESHSFCSNGTMHGRDKNYIASFACEQ